MAVPHLADVGLPEAAQPPISSSRVIWLDLGHILTGMLVSDTQTLARTEPMCPRHAGNPTHPALRKAA